MFSTLGYLICIPFAALLRLFNSVTQSYGLSLVLFTIVTKLVMLPFQLKSKKSMVRMNRLQPRMQEIQKMYAKNPQKQNEEIQKLYQEAGASPMGGCLWSFLPMFIIIPLYSIIRMPITRFMMLGEEVVEQARTALSGAGVELLMQSGTKQAYAQIELVEKISNHLPEFAQTVEGWVTMDYNFLGLNLGSNAAAAFKQLFSGGFNWANLGLVLLPLACAGVSLLQSLISMKGQPSNPTAKSMMLTMPLMSIWICWSFPAAMGIYWLVQSLLFCVQESVFGKYYTKKLEEEEEEAEKKREAARKYRQEANRQLQQEQAKHQAEREKQREKELKAKKAAEASNKKKNPTSEAGRVGDRPYARGRSFSEDHYGN
ncbi:MAG: membrane protein insertase YidC [Oscillospiraceae bacterium]|nr:membrane protein insertase YidC [Oscillospiraceae bacterium]